MAADERVRAAEAAVREACAELRWNEALRRRWREARAEAAIRGAIASGGVEGAVVSAEVLREQVAAGSLTQAATGDPGLDAVAGLWRAGTRLVGWMPDLVGRGRPVVPPARSLLATVHRDVVGPLAAGGRVALEEVGVPRAGQVRAREGGPGVAPQGEELVARLAAAYAEAAGAYASGTMDGVVAWVVWQAEAVLAGVQEAQRLCLAVQAGTWRAG